MLFKNIPIFKITQLSKNNTIYIYHKVIKYLSKNNTIYIYHKLIKYLFN